MSGIEEYRGRHLVVINEARRCIHSRYCVLNLPGVFRPNVDGPWIEPDAGNAEAVIAVIARCPSGALRYRPEGRTSAEGAPGVNTMRVMEDGPLVVHAELNVEGNVSSRRATLCRCGKSFNKPYCDRMHVKSSFKATGEPPSVEGEALPVRSGPLAVTPTRDGPLHVEGPLEICSASGRTLARTSETWLCRCGHSRNKPFCDGSHESAGFKAPGA
jgi:CDGSH-type Zn-finger protein/uncharacterized Fe-S cluster protein YjdI